MQKNLNYELCKECGGTCCKQIGCGYLPQDFNSMKFDNLKKIISRGNISIGGEPLPLADDFPNWSFALYLRTRHVNAPIVDLIASDGPCKMLREDGCVYSEDKRPSLGLALKPTRVGGPCDSTFTVEPSLEWLKHSAVLARLVKYYTKMDVEEVVTKQMKAVLKSVHAKKGLNLTLSEMHAIGWYKETLSHGHYVDIEKVKKNPYMKTLINENHIC